MTDAEPLVLPVGHYMGPSHPQRGAPPAFHAVRVGWEQARLDGDAQLTVWMLAHGIPGDDPTGAGDRPWTRRSVLEGAEREGIEDPEGTLEGLLDDGLVLEVDPDSAEAFARYHRLEPLLVGIGFDEQNPLSLIGIPGLVVALEAWPRVFELWQWAHLWPDLWSACGALAEASEGIADAGADETDQLQVLAFAVGAIQTLVMHGAAYLDVRHSPEPRASR